MGAFISQTFRQANDVHNSDFVGSSIEQDSEGGRTCLMKASRAGHLCTVKFLLDRGANLNKTMSQNEHTALSLACGGGHVAVVEILLGYGADPYHRLKVSSLE